MGKIMTGRPKWPFRLMLLAWLIVFFTLWNLARLITSIDWHDTLATYAPFPGPVYIGFTGAIWSGMGIFLLWCLRRGKRWTRLALLIGSGIFTAWFWADRLLLQSELRSNWLFTLIANLLILAFIAAVIFDRRIRIHLEREAYERKS